MFFTEISLWNIENLNRKIRREGPRGGDDRVLETHSCLPAYLWGVIQSHTFWLQPPQYAAVSWSWKQLQHPRVDPQWWCLCTWPRLFKGRDFRPRGAMRGSLLGIWSWKQKNMIYTARKDPPRKLGVDQHLIRFHETCIIFVTDCPFVCELDRTRRLLLQWKDCTRDLCEGRAWPRDGGENVRKQTSYVMFTAVSPAPSTVPDIQWSFITYLLNQLNIDLPRREKIVESAHMEEGLVSC